MPTACWPSRPVTYKVPPDTTGAVAAPPGIGACPTGARHFGDLGDPSSAVSQLVKEREGFDLLPEMGFKPVNKYLPPRPRRDQTAAASAQAPAEQPAAGTGSLADRFFAWADRALSR